MPKPTAGKLVRVREHLRRTKGRRRSAVAPEVTKAAAHPFAGLLRESGLTKEEREARGRANALFKREDSGKWDDFIRHARRKSYVEAVQNDHRSDAKLSQHVDQMNRLLTGKTVGRIRGDTGKSYRIVKLRGSDVLGCTCADWRYRRSVAPAGQQECKHVAQWRADHPAATADKTAEAGLPVDVIGLAAATAVALGVATHDLFKSWGYAGDLASIQAKLRASHEGAVDVKEYMRVRDPSVTVVTDGAGVDALVDADVHGAKRELVRGMLHAVVQRGNNAVAFTGRTGAYVIGGGKMHPDIIEHEYGHIQDFREKGILSGESNPYNRGLLHTLLQAWSRSAYDRGIMAAERAAWALAKDSPTKKRTEEEALGTYDKAFYRMRGMNVLSLAVPLALATVESGLQHKLAGEPMLSMKAQIADLKENMRSTATRELAGLGTLAVHPVVGLAHAASRAAGAEVPAIARAAEVLGAEGHPVAHALELGGLGVLAIPSIQELRRDGATGKIAGVRGDLLKGGLADDREPSSFDERRVAEGARVEREHSADPRVQREIARDHLLEDPHYYEKLRRMEKGASSFVSTEHHAAFRKKPGSRECSLGRDDAGYYAYTHRSRSRSYPTAAEIPDGVVRQIGSTG